MRFKKMKNLFLRQSYLDSWEDYERSLRKKNFIKWDYIILTASNDAQAEAYRAQIDERLEKGLLPAETHYAVLPDPDGKRVGSGGATFQVMRYIGEQNSDEGNPFKGRRILVIHSGGDSKRVPQYSATGKLFSPVPRELPDGRGSTLFDEFIIGMSGVPSRIQEGMLVLSGDVLLLFNPLQIDAQFDGAAAISIKEPVSTGKNHGVFLNDGNDYVKCFLHKQTEEHLREMGAVNVEGNVDLDTGAVIFGRRASVGAGAYIENAYVIGYSVIEPGAVLSHVRVCDRHVPADTVLHGTELLDGRYVVRIYGVEDNPKGKYPDSVPFLGTALESMMAANGITPSDLWDGDETYLWFARLYPVCASHEAVCMGS